MATTTPFNLDAALNGKAIGWLYTEAGKEKVNYIVGFRKTSNNLFYEGIDTKDHKLYQFNPSGKSLDFSHQLYLINDTIQNNGGNGVITRADGAEIATINTLNPREEIATQIINSLLTHRSEQIELMSEATINNLANISYNIAQAMLNAASEYRKNDPDPDQQQEATIEASNLNDNTQKILFTLSTTLSNLKKSVDKMLKTDASGNPTNGISLTSLPALTTSIQQADTSPVPIKVTNAADFGTGSSGGSTFDGVLKTPQGGAFPIELLSPATLSISIKDGIQIPASVQYTLKGTFNSINLNDTFFSQSTITNNILHINASIASAERNGIITKDTYKKLAGIMTSTNEDGKYTAGKTDDIQTLTIQEHLNKIYTLLSNL